MGGCVAGNPAVNRLDKATDEIEFIGGMRWSKSSIIGRNVGGNASWPLLRLRLNVHGLSFVPNGVARYIPFIPSYTFSWSNIVRAEGLYRGGIRFVVRSGHPLIFWSFAPKKVLDALESHHVSEPVCKAF